MMRHSVLAFVVVAGLATTGGFAAPGGGNDDDAEEEAFLPVVALVLSGNTINGQTWPDTLLIEAFDGQYVKFAVSVPATDVTQTFRLHGHTWTDSDSGRVVDVIRIDPGETVKFGVTARGDATEIVDWYYRGGADARFESGMWGLFRVHPGLVAS